MAPFRYLRGVAKPAYPVRSFPTLTLTHGTRPSIDFQHSLACLASHSRSVRVLASAASPLRAITDQASPRRANHNVAATRFASPASHVQATASNPSGALRVPSLPFLRVPSTATRASSDKPCLPCPCMHRRPTSPSRCLPAFHGRRPVHVYLHARAAPVAPREVACVTNTNDLQLTLCR